MSQVSHEKVGSVLVFSAFVDVLLFDLLKNGHALQNELVICSQLSESSILSLFTRTGSTH